MPENTSPTRELPKSLQGIETILIYLKDRDDELSSIRNISEQTNISMRVVKNILIQLEKFNQIERVVEKNNVLAKWKITKFGKKVLKQAKGIEKEIKFPSREYELINEITIPDDREELKEESIDKHKKISNELKKIQIELSKTLGTVIDMDNPQFEELISYLIKRIKSLKLRISNLPDDPLKKYTLVKKGAKEKKVSNDDEEALFGEMLFFNSLIYNEVRRIIDLNLKLTSYLESGAVSSGFSSAESLREEIRVLTSLTYQRETLDVNSHVLSKDNLKKMLKNKINTSLIENLIESPVTDDERLEGIKEVVMWYVSLLSNGDKKEIEYPEEISEYIPLFTLYQLILDEKTNIYFTIEQLEQTINSLADEGYLPGLKNIQEDEDHFLKVVQLKIHDMSTDEELLISKALLLEKFSLVEMVKEIGWETKKVQDLLTNLSELGILKHNKSFLHGDRWYVIS